MIFVSDPESRAVGWMIRIVVAVAAIACTACGADKAPNDRDKPGNNSTASATVLEAAVRDGMVATQARGLAIAIVRDGTVSAVHTFGDRNETGDPLTADTVMYGASLTKSAFAYMVLQLVDERFIDLDTSIADYLPEPLPTYKNGKPLYAPWDDLAGDERWRKLTPRLLLAHSSGFHNYWFFEPDRTLRFHFDPGSRYAYSGDGYILLQFVLERGLGLDVGKEMRSRVFEPLGMTRTDMMWRDDFATDLADGWTMQGNAVAHDDRSKVRAAGSMDTTIADAGRLAAALVTCAQLSKIACEELTAPSMPITTASQFPTLQDEVPEGEHRPDLAAGLGVITFSGPQGPAFYKGGHDESTGNTMVCVRNTRDCVVVLSNDVRAEASFPMIVRAVLSETGVPWEWEYPTLELMK